MYLPSKKLTDQFIQIMKDEYNLKIPEEKARILLGQITDFYDLLAKMALENPKNISVYKKSVKIKSDHIIKK